ncbi:hypothetical protein Q1695_011723 [Nippostrongylus brasiliensis]|nr:hypothetical protein Q1695_011723 [Nippostrongylus brasiliensis]
MDTELTLVALQEHLNSPRYPETTKRATSVVHRLQTHNTYRCLDSRFFPNENLHQMEFEQKGQHGVMTSLLNVNFIEEIEFKRGSSYIPIKPDNTTPLRF